MNLFCNEPIYYLDRKVVKISGKPIATLEEEMEKCELCIFKNSCLDTRFYINEMFTYMMRMRIGRCYTDYFIEIWNVYKKNLYIFGEEK